MDWKLETGNWELVASCREGSAPLKQTQVETLIQNPLSQIVANSGSEDPWRRHSGSSRVLPATPILTRIAVRLNSAEGKTQLRHCCVS